MFLNMYLVSTTELSQVLKFPVLVEHYFEHQEKNPRISVGVFLIDHYSNHLEDHLENTDFERDKKLPFILHNQVLAVTFILVSPVVFEAKTRQPALEHPMAVVLGKRFIKINLSAMSGTRQL